MSEDLSDFQRGLDSLLDDAHARVDAAVDDKYERVRWSRARLARYQAAMQELKADVTYTRTCEAHLGQFLLGYAQQAALPAPEATVSIRPPQHQPSSDEISQLAETLAHEAPPRFLQPRVQ